MKYLFILLFAAFGLSVSAQDTSPEVTRLVDQELKMIEKDLKSQEEPYTLTPEQTVKLKELLLVKSEKVNAVRVSTQDKLSKSQNIGKINKEFEPAILAIFDTNQKKAFKASARNKRRYKESK